MKKLLFYAAVVVAMVTVSCDDDNDSNGNNGDDYDVVYLQTNDYNTGQNAILAYRDDGDGNLAALPGSPFSTNGAGVGNPMQLLGPSDSDYELRRSADGNFLLAVNSGSNSIAVMEIASDGSLSHVSGSPFPSGGETPVSIDVSGNKVFVVNKSQNPLSPTTTAPNYSVFTINGGGQLSAVAGGTVETTPGSSPANAYVSRNGDFLFGTDFLGFMLPTPVGTLRSFEIGSNGTLTAVAGTPYVLPQGAMPPDNGALGLWQHPSADILYVGIPVQGKIGVYNINQTSGELSLATTVAAGKAACWIRTNDSGNRLYVLNSGDNTVQVYDSSSAGSPSSMQVLELKNSGPTYPGPGGVPFKTSEAFSLHFSTDDDRLYIVAQHTNPDFTIGNFNYLHTLNVASDGTLTEPTEPIQLPVSNMLRPKGSVVVSAHD
jgi:6-phosphogluconolactonase (cycloisomerase 2 family)